VPKPLRDHRDGNPTQPHERAAGVTGVVRPNAWDTQIVKSSGPSEPEDATVVRLAAFVAGDMLTRAVPLAEREAFFELALTCLAQ
jgi:hypothetical protein